jgi:AcrR family transcriptional regulator
MPREQGLRERKKAQQRERIADIAAGLFAEHGYDGVSVLDVARTAAVSDQTIYNYFPAKHDLVLDRADEFRELYGQAVLDRPRGASPADALRPLVAADIDRYRGDNSRLARGQFPVLCRDSGALRRFALELREQQVDRVVVALGTTDAGILPIVARVHAAALICVVQTITDEIGAHILAGTPTDTAAAEMTHTATIALDHLDRAFHSLILRTGDLS